MCKRTVIYYPRESVASLMCPIGFDYGLCLSSLPVQLWAFHSPVLYDYPPNLSILLSGGNENNYESVSNGERILICPNST